ncbi:MAG TPA: apolipoprotein N-acyltransferase, partial [Bacteroidales bacterium]|nr:apolipoprotein N-acyltransferase [Bacteroidales bacterium]
GLISMGWMRVASITGAICVIMGLAFLMSFTMWVAHLVRLKAGNVPGMVAFITFWLSFEFLSLNVNNITPWLNLGNGLSKDITFIQWYDITGTSGGSLWILSSNLLLSTFIINSTAGKKYNKLIFASWLMLIIIPATISVIRYNTIKQNRDKASEVVVIQPNTDPYTEKFTIPFEKQLKGVIAQAAVSVSDSTKWIITPETTIDDPINTDDLENNKYIRLIHEFTEQHPSASVVSGMITYKLYPHSEKAPTKSARKIDESGLFYDHFNSALKIDTGKSIGIYNKSKLVPGIEMQFSTGPGRMISKILPYLGGTKWGYGIQNERICFEHPGTRQKIAPVVCYESVFGKYVTDYVKKGAEAVFIITNDGWWKNTNGYKQHLSYASLRAIETRRPVVRSANTGISCIIDITGKRIKETSWWTPAVLTGDICPETRITPYVRYGDLLMLISSGISLIILLSVFIIMPIRKNTI